MLLFSVEIRDVVKECALITGARNALQDKNILHLLMSVLIAKMGHLDAHFGYFVSLGQSFVDALQSVY